ncbi:MAG: type IV pilus assembly protein PilM [Thermoguttaceae bacterium]
MATTSAVWGIDVGNSSLKAIRCTHGENGKIEAVACDFIEHTKMLSQPGVVHADVLAETFQTFASRNDFRRDKIAISVSGQQTISRFLRLPPVDPKKVGDIIKYEARQWLPFAMDEVIWDFQAIGDTDTPGDDFFDAEVGMFAMKRDIAFKHIKPYVDADFDVDCVQSAPLALYNYAVFDILRRAEHQYKLDPNNPPERIAILSVGTDSSDIIVTNGFSIWTRSISIGGHNFTKALIKAVKLTHSKAEYLKRNAQTAQDPKAVFQAMRPVFNEMLTEVQRSIEYYKSVQKGAEISKIYAVGNAVKLPGLRQFLGQNLGIEVERVQSFHRLTGNDVLANPEFRNNVSAFAVPYGLAVQMLGEASLSINLIPKEIVVDRIIRSKKPWALAAAAAILLGLTVQFLGASWALSRVSTGEYSAAEAKAKAAQDRSSKLTSECSAAKSKFTEIDTIGKNLTGTVEGRIIWCELFRAINEALPQERDRLDGRDISDIENQDRVFITSIDTIAIEDVTEWWDQIKAFELYVPDDRELLEAGVEAEKLPPMEDLAARIALLPPLEKGAAKIVQITGYHFHNPGNITGKEGVLLGAHYLRETFLKNLKYHQLQLPPGMNAQLQAGGAQAKTEEVSMRELGIYYPTLLSTPEVTETQMINPRVLLEKFIENAKKASEMMKKRQPNALTGGGGMGGSPMGGSGPMGGGMGGSPMGGGMGRGATGGFGGSGGSFGGGMGGGQGGMMSLPNPFSPPAVSLRSSSQSGGMGPGSSGMGPGGGMGGGAGNMSINVDEIDEKDKVVVRRFDFVIQFAWFETPPSVREAKKLEAEQKAAAADASGGGTAGSPASPTSTVPAAPTSLSLDGEANTTDTLEAPSETTHPDDTTPADDTSSMDDAPEDTTTPQPE